MDFNYAALALAILKGYTPEQAFRVMERPQTETLERIYTKQDTKDMVSLKRSYSYQEIALMYNMSWDSVRRRIKRYVKKAPCKASRIS